MVSRRPRSRSVCLGFILASCVAGAACASADDSRVSVAPTLLAPRALLDRVSKIDLRVMPAGSTCDDATGTVTDMNQAAVTSAELTAAACTGKGSFCGSLSLEQDAKSHAFWARALDVNGALFMTACATAKLDKAQVEVPLTLKRRARQPRFELNFKSGKTGAANRTRTCDPVITNDVLYQLSYCGGPSGAFGQRPENAGP